MILETIVAWLLVAFIAFILIVMYYEFTDKTNIPNIFEIVREILGGWILAATLYSENLDYREYK